MKKEEFYYKSGDGETEIHAVRYLPDHGRVAAVLQIIHGMAEYIERYEEFAEWLTDRGILVTGEDHLGHGGSVPKSGIYGYFCEKDPADVVIGDVHRLRELTESQYPEIPYMILGHSMGSFILRNYLCLYGRGIAGAVIMGTGMQPKALLKVSRVLVALQRFLNGSHHKSKFINVCAFGTYNKKINPMRTRFDWLSRDEKLVDRYMEDSRCGFTFTVNGFHTLFELIYRLHDSDFLSHMPKELPVFLVSGAEDPVGDYGEGVKAVYASLQDAGLKNLQLKLYENDRHEILNELDRNVVMQDIYDWVKEVI